MKKLPPYTMGMGELLHCVMGMRVFLLNSLELEETRRT